MKGGVGLSRVPDRELELVLRWIHKGAVTLPITRATALASGLPYLADHGDVLFGLDAKGAHAAIVCALGERRAQRSAAAPMPESE